MVTAAASWLPPPAWSRWTASSTVTNAATAQPTARSFSVSTMRRSYAATRYTWVTRVKVRRQPRYKSADVEAVEALGLFVGDLDVLHLGTVRSRAGELDHRVDGLRVTLEHGLHRAVGAVRNPARHPAAARTPAHVVAEEHALHAPAHDDPLPDRALAHRGARAFR